MFLTFSADVLGHPFGKVPSPRPFDGSVEDSEVILSDPCNPLGKEMLTGRNMQLTRTALYPHPPLCIEDECTGTSFYNH